MKKKRTKSKTKKKSKRFKIKSKRKRPIKKYIKSKKRKNRKKQKKNKKIKIKKKKISKTTKKLEKLNLLITKYAVDKINKYSTDKIKKVTLTGLVSFLFKPFVNVFEEFKKKHRIYRINQLDLQRKQREKKIREEEKLRMQIKEKELKDEIRFAKELSRDLKNFLRKEQAIIRVEQKSKEKKFLEEIKLEKKIQSFRKRELQEIKNLEKFSLKEQREDYASVQNRIEQIKQKYRLLREQKIRDRVESLGLKISDTDSKEDLLQREKEYAFQRQQIELVLESFYRSANALIFQINKKFIPKHRSILRVIDRRYETNECFIRYDDARDEDWLILIYLEDSNPKKEKIIVENKANPEKHETKIFQKKDIFAYSDYLVDVMTSHIDRERQKKAS